MAIVVLQGQTEDACLDVLHFDVAPHFGTLEPGGSLSGTFPDIDLVPTGVVAGTYGDATHVARITVREDGRLSDAEEVEITGGGLSGIDEGALVYGAADGTPTWDVGRLLLDPTTEVLRVRGTMQTVLIQSTTTAAGTHTTSIALLAGAGGVVDASGDARFGLTDNAGVPIDVELIVAPNIPLYFIVGGSIIARCQPATGLTAWQDLLVGRDASVVRDVVFGRDLFGGGGAFTFTDSTTLLQVKTAGLESIVFEASGAGGNVYVRVGSPLRSDQVVSASAVGAVVGVLAVFDASGTLIGYFPIYDTFTP